MPALPNDSHPGSVRGAIDGVIEMKLVSYNIQYGTGRDGVVDLSRIARGRAGVRT
jgi:endonuclease/exonuclease/phosphatase family metal-dependent hydrolase